MVRVVVMVQQPAVVVMLHQPIVEATKNKGLGYNASFTSLLYKITSAY